MIELQEVLIFHQKLIEEFGGSPGVRSVDLLEAALGRPYQTFDGQELYPSPEAKASAILESIVTNHPFIDGNKRIGYVLMRLILLGAGKDIEADEEEKYQFIIEVASGKRSFDSILEWIELRIKDR